MVNLLKEGLARIEIDQLKNYMQQKGEECEIGLGVFMQVLRVAIVGALSGPDLIPLVKILGKDVTLERLDRLMSKF